MNNRSDGSSADYYRLPRAATQLQHLISHRNMNAQIGEIFRACYRYGQASHSDQLRDAKKIKFYAEAEVERLTKQVDATPVISLDEWATADRINELKAQAVSDFVSYLMANGEQVDAQWYIDTLRNGG
jgi:hypothetical protein